MKIDTAQYQADHGTLPSGHKLWWFRVTFTDKSTAKFNASADYKLAEKTALTMHPKSIVSRIQLIDGGR